MRRDALLSLSDAEVETLEADNTALVDYLTVFLPELGMLNTAVSFPRISEEQEPLNEARFGWEIPGRIACTGMVWGKRSPGQNFSADMGPANNNRRVESAAM